ATAAAKSEGRCWNVVGGFFDLQFNRRTTEIFCAGDVSLPTFLGVTHIDEQGVATFQRDCCFLRRNFLNILLRISDQFFESCVLSHEAMMNDEARMSNDDAALTIAFWSSPSCRQFS